LAIDDLGLKRDAGFEKNLLYKFISNFRNYARIDIINFIAPKIWLTQPASLFYIYFEKRRLNPAHYHGCPIAGP